MIMVNEIQYEYYQLNKSKMLYKIWIKAIKFEQNKKVFKYLNDLQQNKNYFSPKCFLLKDVLFLNLLHKIFFKIL